MKQFMYDTMLPFFIISLMAFGISLIAVGIYLVVKLIIEMNNEK